MYISNGQGYTYGVKTFAQIDSVTGMVAGETCYCSDNHKVLTYDGDVWMCSDFIKMTNNSGITLDRGDVVIPETSVGSSCTTTTSADAVSVLGVIVFGGIDTAEVAIAWQGVYDVNVVNATTVGDFLATATTATAATEFISASAGTFAISVEDIGAGGLVRAIIFTRSEYF